MKRIIVILLILAVASLAMASTEVSPIRGKVLFKSKQLGTNGKSCDNCHPDGKGLAKAAEYGERELGEIINQCIKNPLKGKALDPNSVEIKSLIMYIKSLTPSARH